MAVTFMDNAKDGVPVAIEDRDPEKFYAPDGRVIEVEQFETFGQLRCSQTIIADYYGVSRGKVAAIMGRSEYRAAWKRGRAEAVIAHRHKQFSLGLAGDARMLTGDMAEFYGEMSDTPRDDDVQTAQASRAWTSAVLERAKDAHQSLLDVLENAPNG